MPDTVAMDASISPRDREILRAEVADYIEALRPLTRMGIPWREVFTTEVTRWRTKANGCPATSETRREYVGWALAHQLLLEEA